MEETQVGMPSFGRAQTIRKMYTKSATNNSSNFNALPPNGGSPQTTPCGAHSNEYRRVGAAAQYLCHAAVHDVDRRVQVPNVFHPEARAVEQTPDFFSWESAGAGSTNRNGGQPFKHEKLAVLL